MSSPIGYKTKREGLPSIHPGLSSEVYLTLLLTYLDFFHSKGHFFIWYNCKQANRSADGQRKSLPMDTADVNGVLFSL